MKRYFAAYIALALCISCQESFENRLSRETAEFTSKHCPQEPEPGTRLDSLTFDTTSRTYTLWYTLSADNEYLLGGNASLMRDNLLHRLRNDEQSKEMKEHNINFRYVYSSQMSGKVIYETVLRPADYNVPGH